MIRRLDFAPGQRRLIADAEIRCRRCGRRLRSDRAVVLGIGEACRQKEKTNSNAQCSKVEH